MATNYWKLHEDVWRRTLKEANERYKEEAPKGEFVLIVEGAKIEDVPEITFPEAVSMAEKLMANGLPASAAAKDAAKATGFKKSDIYSALVK